MTAFNQQSSMLLADGWSELIGVIVVFGLYAVGTIVKKLGGGKDEQEASKTSYTIELAKKRAKERQAVQQQARLEQARRQAAKNYGPRSEWDRTQESKRLKMQQMRQRIKQPPAQPIPKPVSPPAHKPDTRTPEYKRAPKPQKQWPFVPVQAQRPQPPQPKRVRARETYPAVQKQPARRIAKKIRQVKSEPAKMKTIQAGTLDTLLGQPGDLRSAIILKEILDKPIALRQDWSFSV